MKRIETAAALLAFALAVIVVLGTTELAFWQRTAPGPRFMPLAVAVVTAVLAVLLFLDARRRDADEPVDWPDREGAVRVVLSAAAIVAYVAAAPWLGFVVGSAVFVLVFLLAVLRRPILPSIATAAITAVLIQGIFVSWLGTALPRGVLGI